MFDYDNLKPIVDKIKELPEESQAETLANVVNLFFGIYGELKTERDLLFQKIDKLNSNIRNVDDLLATLVDMQTDIYYRKQKEAKDGERQNNDNPLA